MEAWKIDTIEQIEIIERCEVRGMKEETARAIRTGGTRARREVEG